MGIVEQEVAVLCYDNHTRMHEPKIYPKMNHHYRRIMECRCQLCMNISVMPNCILMDITGFIDELLES